MRIVFSPNGYVTSDALNGNDLSDLLNRQSVFDAVFRPCDDAVIVHPLPAEYEMLLKLGAAPALDKRHILIGRKFGFAVGVHAPVPFTAFMPVYALGDVVVAVECERDNSLEVLRNCLSYMIV